jgi:hypothetical protein
MRRVNFREQISRKLQPPHEGSTTVMIPIATAVSPTAPCMAAPVYERGRPAHAGRFRRHWLWT